MKGRLAGKSLLFSELCRLPAAKVRCLMCKAGREGGARCGRERGRWWVTMRWSCRGPALARRRRAAGSALGGACAGMRRPRWRRHPTTATESNLRTNPSKVRPGAVQGADSLTYCLDMGNGIRPGRPGRFESPLHLNRHLHQSPKKSITPRELLLRSTWTTWTDPS